MDNLLIRRVKAEDSKDIARIYTSIVKRYEEIDFERLIREQVRNTGMANFVAEVKGKVIGFIISYTLSGGFGIDKSAWIAMVGVDPKSMGKGIGKALADELFRFYKDQGINNIYTSVRWDSTDLLSFFKTLEFDRSDFINLRKVE
ncbi:MAG TPA: GNAT family N-acetyltransferase [Desulfatiglandales bacterium]|nr:GNAT family N-acetyltransferase [Desulfatiglandales bacterium]